MTERKLSDEHLNEKMQIYKKTGKLPAQTPFALACIAGQIPDDASTELLFFRVALLIESRGYLDVIAYTLGIIADRLEVKKPGDGQSLRLQQASLHIREDKPEEALLLLASITPDGDEEKTLHEQLVLIAELQQANAA